MTDVNGLPCILVIDDLFGRTHLEKRNRDRASLCAQYLLEDITGDEDHKGVGQRIHEAVALAEFVRGQTPASATIGDTVENDLEGILNLIRKRWIYDRSGAPRWALVLLDLCFYTGRVTPESDARTLGMPEGRPDDQDPSKYFGLRILEGIHREFPELPVVILSSMPREEVSHKFAAHGALGFLPRADPASPELLKEYIWRHGLIPDESGHVVGRSKALLVALRAARRAAFGRGNVLIRGERGTGKELAAQYLHQVSNRREAPFVIVNSSVFTTELFASDLFGIQSRVATNVDQREGLIRQANGGDLFLDEIKDMPAQVQAGVLRILEERKVTPVGGRSPVSVDVRFLSATNADVEELSATGEFRADLLDRVREGGTIVLPPLRERKEDIPLLVERFVRDAEKEHGRALHRQVDAAALERLVDHDWPGNIRELRSCIFSAVESHPDVEHLVESHIRISEQSVSAPSPRENLVAKNQLPSLVETRDVTSASELDQLLCALEEFPFQPEEMPSISGKLPKLERAYADLVARYLRSALLATKKLTPDEPEGKIQIHPAVKLITGDAKITASKAADLIKRMAKITRPASDLWKSDSTLSQALETAIRLRQQKEKP